jgi:hypothetical protein
MRADDEIRKALRPSVARKISGNAQSFFRLIVNAKTPADSMSRLRQFLREKMRHEARPRDAHWDIPRKQFTEDERDAWATSQIQAINNGDKNGGYFTKEIWLGMGSAYRYWWAKQKSIKAGDPQKSASRPLDWASAWHVMELCALNAVFSNKL